MGPSGTSEPGIHLEVHADHLTEETLTNLVEMGLQKSNLNNRNRYVCHHQNGSLPTNIDSRTASFLDHTKLSDERPSQT